MIAQIRFVLLAGAVSWLPLTRADPQQAPVLPEGARIRWMFEDNHTRFTGTVVRAHFDTVFAQPTDSGQVIKLLRGDLQELSLSHGKTSSGRGAWKGGRIGLVLGVGTAFAASYATGCFEAGYDAWNQQALNNRNCIGWGPLAGIVVGETLLGALVGSQLARGEDWVQVPLYRLRGGLTLGRVRLVLTL